MSKPFRIGPVPPTWNAGKRIDNNGRKNAFRIPVKGDQKDEVKTQCSGKLAGGEQCSTWLRNGNTTGLCSACTDRELYGE